MADATRRAAADAPRRAAADALLVAEGHDEPDAPTTIGRRSFIARASFASLAAFATIAGAPRTAKAAGRPEPPPCRIRCQPISRTGCACGGNLYRCKGCSRTFHACVKGKTFGWFCLRRHC